MPLTRRPDETAAAPQPSRRLPSITALSIAALSGLFVATLATQGDARYDAAAAREAARAAVPDAAGGEPAAPAAARPSDLDQQRDGMTEVLYLTRPEVLQPPPSKTVLDIQVEVKSGDTLGGLLSETGISGDDAREAITALRTVFDPRDLRVGQQLSFTLESQTSVREVPGLSYEEATQVDEQVRLASLRFTPAVAKEILVARDDDGKIYAKRLETPLLQADNGAYGVVRSSLYEAAAKRGVPAPVIASLIRLLSYDVDFQRDIHEGDGFEVLYESQVTEDGQIVKTGNVLFAQLMLQDRDIRVYRFTPPGGEPEYFDSKGRSIRKTLLRTPVDGARISSGFGYRRHPILGYSKLHKGMDFAAPSGTPVFAAGDGVIERANRFSSYGNYVRIKHNGTYSTAYAHLSRFARGIKAGTRVRQGQVIAYVGTTGRSTGPHLHYEVLDHNKQVNPAKITSLKADELTGKALVAFNKFREELDRRRGEVHTRTLLAAVPQR